MKPLLQLYGTYVIALILECQPTPSEAACMTVNFTDCTYSVVCRGEPSRSITPDCNRAADLTFLLLDSSREFLTYSYFSSTNFDSRVRTFRASNNSWTTLDSNVMRYYPYTFYMHLSGNNIHNLRDDAFSSLGILRLLDLSHNYLVRLTSRTLFTGSQSKLVTLDLSYNKIVCVNSDTFKYHTELHTLDLSHNSIITLEDNCFAGLNSLLSIYFTGNSLNSFNVSLINLKSLKLLNASSNRFEKLDSYELRRLVSLQTLTFHHNSLTSIDVDLFQPFDRLDTVDLSYNRINGQITANMFKSNSKLTSLNVCHNNISYIEDKSFISSVIKDFNFTDNDFSGEITEFTLSGLDEVVRLDLSNQSITAVRSLAFSNMTNLTWLNLSSNVILEVEINSFNRESSLVTLDLSHNKLTILNCTFEGLSKLRTLYLQSNNIRVIISNVFSDLLSLDILDLSYNHISSIEPSILPLKHLKSLYITNNLITGEVNSKMFSPAPLLTELDISGFSLTKIHNNSFYDSPMVKHINLSNNAITTIEFDSFKDLNSLESLDLSRNNLSDIQFNKSGMTKLRNIFIAHNNIKTIPKDAFNLLPHLEQIDLSANKISFVTPNSFSSLDLRALNLAGNEIRKFDGVFAHFTNISILNLSANRIDNINVTYFNNLIELDLSANVIGSLGASFLVNLSKKITYLNLSQNSISSLAPGMFLNSCSLRYLNVSYNRIGVLRYGALRGLSELQVLDVSGNLLRQLDVDLLHECPRLRSLFLDYNSISSLDVARLAAVLKDLRQLSLGGNPMSCKEVISHLRNSSSDLEIDSVNRVYHVDNVNGIECERTTAMVSTTTAMVSTTTKSSTATQQGGGSNNALLGVAFVWCSVISVFVLVSFIAMYYFRRSLIMIYGASRYQERTVSLELDSS